MRSVFDDEFDRERRGRENMSSRLTGNVISGDGRRLKEEEI